MTMVMRPLLAVLLGLALAAPVHGGDDHAHADAPAAAADHHDHAPHDDGLWHRLQDWVIGLLGGVHPHGDDAHADHGHDHGAVTITHFTGPTELYVEFPPLIAGETAEFLVHLTALADFSPVESGTVTVRLAGGGAPEEVFSVSESARPGLFRVPALPEHATLRTLSIVLDSPVLTATHDLGPQPVYPDEAIADAVLGEPEEAEPLVAFLKEQQWQADFATAPAVQGRLRGSVPATSTLRPSADGEAHITAPSAGHLTAAESGFPFTGVRVERGQILAYLAPLLGGETDVAALELAVKRAESSHALARQERARLEDLLARQAVPRRRVLEARSAEDIARAELEAARRRLAQITRGPGADGAGVAVRAPITGTIAYVNVAPGGYVEQGERLFHVVDRDRLWLEARLAEADLGRIRQPQGAWFRAEGFEEVVRLDVEAGARLVAFGGMVDPVSRTVPIVFEFPNPDERLRVGLFVAARVFTGEVQEGVTVPAAALVDDGGTPVVYVQRDGEHFERRVVRPGLRDGERIAIAGGLAEGERVVSRGAYLVHLAAGAPAEVGHGHAH